MEIIVEIFAELFLQLFIELLAEIGIHTFTNMPKPHPVIASIGYLLFGAILGGLSLLIFKDSFIADEPIQMVNLIVTPIFLGIIMSVIGSQRQRRDKEVIGIEKFSYGFLFAFGLALVRYVFAG